MRALRLAAYAPLSMELETYEVADAPPPGHILVEARTTAISAGTEIANFRGMTTYRSAANPDWRNDPYVPGYSLAGVVKAVGEGVTTFAPGDRVCGWGPHASCASVEASRFVRIPDAVSFDHAAMTTLCLIVMNAVRLAKLQLGDRVAVVGAGLIGQLALQLSRLSGGRPVVTIDPIERRRELGISLGASFGVDPSDGDVRTALEATMGRPDFDAVFEATGSPLAFNPAARLVTFGGRLILLGSTRGLVEQFDPYTDVHLNGVTVIGAHMRTAPPVETIYHRWTAENNRRLALEMIADGTLKLEPLISHRVAGDEGPTMYQRLTASREEFFGVLLQWAG
ncbi:MAG: zinc-binding dehydrogenase [Chloroflexota bacterium]